jgi:arylsulfatase A-like enzyme
MLARARFAGFPVFIACLMLLGASPAAARGPDIVLITVDTLRPDHLGCYGYGRPTSPWIDALAGRGLRFETALSTSSWTPPAMASVMTSLYPRDHAVTHGLVRTDALIEQEILADTLSTLAEQLQDAGYHTFGVSTTAHLTREQGFAQGFDRFEYLDFSNARAARQALLRHRIEIRRCQRAFIWIHLFDPHDPYIPHTPWAQGFEPRIIGLRDLRLRGTLREIREMWDREAMPKDPALLQVRALQAAYDSEIRQMDGELALLFAELDLGPNTIVALTADHGEAFFEHGHLGHGQNLHEELVRIPLIVAGPPPLGLRGVVRSPVSLLDVMPTLLELAGAPAPPRAAGTSLLRTASEERAGRGAPDRPLFAEVWDQDPGSSHRVWKMIRKGHEKLLLRVGADDTLLFDLAADPEERHDQSGSRPERRAGLLAELEAWIRSGGKAVRSRTIALNEETREKLRALGYVDD